MDQFVEPFGASKVNAPMLRMPDLRPFFLTLADLAGRPQSSLLGHSAATQKIALVETSARADRVVPGQRNNPGIVGGGSKR